MSSNIVDTVMLLVGAALAAAGLFVLWGVGWGLLVLGIATMAVAIIR